MVSLLAVISRLGYEINKTHSALQWRQPHSGCATVIAAAGTSVYLGNQVKPHSYTARKRKLRKNWKFFSFATPFTTKRRLNDDEPRFSFSSSFLSFKFQSLTKVNGQTSWSLSLFVVVGKWKTGWPAEFFLVTVCIYNDACGFNH